MEKNVKTMVHGVFSILVMVFIFFINEQAQASMILTYDGQAHIYDAPPITININGKTLSGLPVPPVVIDGFTLVPVKEVFTALGAVVDWKDSTQEVYIGLNGNLMILKINSKEVNLNGTIYSMNLQPKIINDKTMVPLRFPLEAFGYVVNWNPFTRVISVESPKDIEIPSSPVPTMTVISQIPTVTPTSVPVSTQTVAASGTSEEAYEGKLNFPSQVTEVASKAQDLSPTVIPAMKYPETVITKINIPANLSESFSIEAKSEISKVDKFVLPDNRLVIDIYDATCWLESLYDLPNNPIVARIRTAQNQVTPQKITRIVFDLNTAAGFNLTISNDRKKLYLSFERNSVLGVTFSQAGEIDRVTMICENPPGFDDFPLTSPDRLVIDVQLATLKQPVNQKVSGKYITAIRAEQYDATTTRIVLDLNQIVKYDIKITGSMVVIELSELTIKNMIYLADQSLVKIKKNPNYPVDIGKIIHTDDYNGFKYELNLGGDYRGYLGSGEYMIKNVYMYSISVANNQANQTVIQFNENQIFAYDITEDAEFISIRIMNPKEKYKRVIVIDAGHGDKDFGTHDEQLTFKEKDINLDVLLRTMNLFEGNKDIKVYATRLTDVFPELADRAAMANQIADAFVSIHVNSAVKNDKVDAGPNGTEVHFYPHDNDNSVGITTMQFAQICQNNMLAVLGSNDRKLKKTNLQVLRETTVPSALIELGFRTNPEEMQKLKTPEYRQQAAIGVYNSILELFAKYTPKR